MRLRRRNPAPEREAIVPLIDVVFFLLVFFLLVGRYDATAPFEVLPPITAIGETLPAGGRTVSVAADGRLALDGVAAGRDEILSRLGGGAEGDRALVRLNAHADAPVGAILPLAAALEEAGVGNVVLVVTPGTR